MASHGREVVRGQLLHKNKGTLKKWVVVAYCGSTSQHSAQLKLFEHSDEEIIKKGQKPKKCIELASAKIDDVFSLHNNRFQNINIISHVFYITTPVEMHEFHAESGYQHQRWMRRLRLLVQFPYSAIPEEPRSNPIKESFRCQFDPTQYGADSAWPVFIFPEEVGTRCNISGVNVLTFQSGVPGRSVGKLSIFNPADSSHPLVSWELHNMRRRGSTGDLFFIEIGRHCEGGPGLVWMYAGLKDAQTLREMLRKLFRGDGNAVAIAAEQTDPIDVPHYSDLTSYHGQSPTSSGNGNHDHNNPDPQSDVSPTGSSELPPVRFDDHLIYERHLAPCDIPGCDGSRCLHSPRLLASPGKIANRDTSSNAVCYFLMNQETSFKQEDSLSLSLSPEESFCAAVMAKQYSPKEEIKLVDLDRELCETGSWVHLGLYFGLPKHKLNEIHADYGTQGLGRCKLEMLDSVLDRRGATLSWDAVVEAVSKTGNNRIAKKIADKHGVQFTATDDTVMSASEEVDTELQLLKEKVQAISKKLESGETQVQACSKRKHQLEGDFAEAQQNHEFAQKYTSMLVEDKRIFQQKLEQREDQIAHLQSTQLEYERTIRGLEVTLAGASANLEAQQKLKDKLKRYKEQKQNLVDHIESNQREMERLREKKDELKRKLDKSNKAISDAESQLKVKNDELVQAKEELKHLKEENDRLLEQLRKQEKDTDVAIVSHRTSGPAMEESSRYENLKVSTWVEEMEEMGKAVLEKDAYIRKLERGSTYINTSKVGLRAEMEGMDKAMLEKDAHIQELEREGPYTNTSIAGLRAELEGMEKELHKLKGEEQDLDEGSLHSEEDKLEAPDMWTLRDVRLQANRTKGLSQGTDRPPPPLPVPQNAQMCKICAENDENAHMEPCGHFICHICLRDWWDSGQSNCPFCREEIKDVVIDPFGIRQSVEDNVEAHSPERWTLRDIQHLLKANLPTGLSQRTYLLAPPLPVKQNAQMCKICAENDEDARMEPCSHLMCHTCLRDSGQSNSPFCHGDIKQWAVEDKLEACVPERWTLRDIQQQLLQANLSTGLTPRADPPPPPLPAKQRHNQPARATSTSTVTATTAGVTKLPEMQTDKDISPLPCLVNHPPPLPPYRSVREEVPAEDRPPLPPRKKNANSNAVSSITY